MRIFSLLKCGLFALTLMLPAASGAADLNLAVGSSIVGGTIHIMGTALAPPRTPPVRRLHCR